MAPHPVATTTPVSNKRGDASWGSQRQNSRRARPSTMTIESKAPPNEATSTSHHAHPAKSAATANAAAVRRIEEAAPDGVTGFRLSTGSGSARNLRILRKAGYRVARTDPPGVVRLVKPRR